jgi:hypothetical protein
LFGSKFELWRALVQYGADISGKNLSDELEHYLVTVFDRTFEPTDGGRCFLDGSIVMMFSDAQSKDGFAKFEALRFVGDACLLRAGFNQFVSKNFKKIERDPKQYYVNIGMSSFMTLYAEYENRRQESKGYTYQLVAHNMNTLVDVLSSIETHDLVTEQLQHTTVGNVTYL